MITTDILTCSAEETGAPAAGFVYQPDDFRFPRSAHRGFSASFPENTSFSAMNKYKSTFSRHTEKYDARRPTCYNDPCSTPAEGQGFLKGKM
ncbi:hypothetical protein [Dehalogenimonas alkenigignens]|nr:hypothetical protein [Dehalogenimonas alkenigignens]